MHKPSSLRDYLIALLVAGALLVGCTTYLLARHGFLFDAPAMFDIWFVPNKAIGNAALLMLALTFLIGPIVRYFDRLDSWLGYRKEIGIIAALLAIFHGFISYSWLPKKFPQQWIDFTSIEFGAGLIGALVLGFLCIASFKKAIMILEGSRWWFIQRFGLRLAILATIVHIVALKGNSWLRWFLTPNMIVSAEVLRPELPALGLLSGLLLGWVIVVRIYESVFLFHDIGFSPKEIVMDPVIKARGRRFFLWSLFVTALLYCMTLLWFVSFLH
jgi:DMSO/TMAO reductase YedYZ heme-binding membrane subunit